MAPVRRTLVAVWIGVGSSSVAKMEGVEDGISMGPSSSAVVVLAAMGSSGTWANHAVPVVVVRWLWAEIEWETLVHSSFS
ncbi:hypothetical protein ACH5RR_037622 [Cinchona calisaya]|uniref:Secreted protein n=1 Tax=Cinchona calisaya TaxID=153742 RepID=A0ABD2Y6Q1_9GENT